MVCRRLETSTKRESKGEEQNIWGHSQSNGRTIGVKMEREKQIKSSDWLIKGKSNEELAEMKARAIEEAEQELREKQIKEMAEVIDFMEERNAHYYNEDLQECEAFADCNNIAEALYNADYRKQVEAEWVDAYGNKYANHRYQCSNCKNDALLKTEMDELLSPKTVQALTPYCPNCGAKMKGN